MGVRERIPEIAILKSLGFRRRPILAGLMAESVLQSLIGGLVGAGGAWAVLGWLHAVGRTGRSNVLGPLGSFEMTPEVFAQGVATAVAVGLVAGIVPAWNGARMNVIQALRQIF
jgi:putative ABC transport system permease protein